MKERPSSGSEKWVPDRDHTASFSSTAVFGGGVSILERYRECAGDVQRKTGARE